MTMYTIVPEEVIWKDAEIERITAEIRINGVLMEVEPLTDGEARIVRLLDCSLEDYLHPGYAPGGRITFIPALSKKG